jgi:hypothetical protein
MLRHTIALWLGGAHPFIEEQIECKGSK